MNIFQKAVAIGMLVATFTSSALTLAPKVSNNNEPITHVCCATTVYGHECGRYRTTNSTEWAKIGEDPGQIYSTKTYRRVVTTSCSICGNIFTTCIVTKTEHYVLSNYVGTTYDREFL